ncbi:MAG: hypothetical protein IID31_07525 [Planctomycetes bacterium]|nr:hypothetical protein [Planctomycetota bacterium]
MIKRQDSVGGVMVAGWDWKCADFYRYDSAGNQIWMRGIGSCMDAAQALAPDGTGGVMVAGWTGGDLGGPNAGRSDVFLARYDSAGNRIWIRQFGTSSRDEALALAPDGAGGVMVAG